MKNLFIPSFVLAIGFWSCGSDSTKNTNDSNPIPVVIFEPSAAKIQEGRLIVNGKMESVQTAHLSSKVMGRIESVTVRQGQNINKGQLLVRIKSDDLQAQKGQTTAVIAEAQAAYINSKTNHDRFSALYAQQSATKFELDHAKMQMDMAQGKLNQAKHAQAQLSAVLSESNVYAPFSGTVTIKHVEVGGMATPGMPLITIESTGQLVLRALVPESEIAYISVGQMVDVAFQSTGLKTQGRISLINPSSSMTGSQYAIEIQLAHLDASQRKAIKSGMYANASIPLPQGRNRVSMINVPVMVALSAIVKQGQMQGVYTVSDDQKAVLHWVRLGKTMGDQVEVLSGLASNEPYILKADGRLYNGVKVSTQH